MLCKWNVCGAGLLFYCQLRTRSAHVYYVNAVPCMCIDSIGDALHSHETRTLRRALRVKHDYMQSTSCLFFYYYKLVWHILIISARGAHSPLLRDVHLGMVLRMVSLANTKGGGVVVVVVCVHGVCWVGGRAFLLKQSPSTVVYF